MRNSTAYRLILTLFILCVLPSIQGALIDGLLGAWEWNNAYNDTLGRNNGTAIGTVNILTNCWFGKPCLNTSADGTDYVNASLEGMRGSNDGWSTGKTISCWAKIPYKSPTIQMAWSIHGATVSSADQWTIWYGEGGADPPTIFWTTGSGPNSYSTGATATSHNDNWFLYTNSLGNASGVYNSTIYFNETRIDSRSPPNAPQPFISKALWLGTGYQDVSKDLLGVLGPCYLWNRTLTASEVSSLYTAGVSGYYYPFTAPSSPALISFIIQIPSDISQLTLFSTNINVTYNYTNTTGLSSAFLNYTIISGSLSCIKSINGTCSKLNNSYMTDATLTNTTGTSGTSYIYTLEENNIYPINAQLVYTDFLYNVHQLRNITPTSQYLSMTYLNVSDQTNINILELMINTTGTNTIYYCNQSYAFSNNPSTNTNCVQIASLSGLTTYNHTHNLNSSHNLISFNINNQKISTIQVRKSVV